MSDFGSISAMNQSLKNNRSLLGERKKFFTSHSDYVKAKNQYIRITGEAFDYKSASKEELAKIRTKFTLQRNKSIKLQILSLILILVTSLLLVKYAIIEPNKKSELLRLQEQQLNLKSKLNLQFAFFIKDGNTWFDKGKYENALFQYKKAYKLKPEDYKANYHLCLGYGYLCIYKNKDCNEGKEIWIKTIEKYPESTELKYLQRLFEQH